MRYRLYAKVLSGWFQCNSVMNLPLRNVGAFYLPLLAGFFSF
jgi:hypothetical protein